jgi:Flp pilus assembly pilin Flp
MRALLRRLARNESGNIIVELALLVPVLLMLLAGLFDFGSAGYTLTSLRSAARTGAEYVSRTGDVAGVTTAVKSAANLDATATVIPMTFCECLGGVAATCGSICADGNGAYEFISVAVRGPHKTLIPYPFLPNDLTFEGRAILRVK